MSTNTTENKLPVHPKDSYCNCAEEISKKFTHYLKEHPECEIYQTSLISSLIAGVYDGETTMSDLLEHGDFGLGTFNHLDGELIAFESNIFQLRGDGTAQRAKMDQKTPFSVMTFFKPIVSYNFDKVSSREEVHKIIDSIIPSDNVFCAIRIDGTFSHVDTRTVPKQDRPYKPMLEVIAKQPVFSFDQCTGTIVGFRSPQYMQGINVAGYHEHFITAALTGGGHIQNYRLEQGLVQIGVISKLFVDIPSSVDFLKANLHPNDLSAAITSAES